MVSFNHAPIHRHESLAPFSRDHYVGLVQAQHMIKAADADTIGRRKTLAEFIDAWDHEIAVHFADEERLLLGLANEADQKRLVGEHETLTDMVRQARALRRQTEPNPVMLRQIGQTLERHIRWEERELFTRIQQQLNADQLDRLHEQTAGIEQSRPRNTRRCNDIKREEASR